MNAPKHLDWYPIGTRLVSRFKHRLMNSKKDDEGTHIYARIIKVDPHDGAATYLVQTSDNCKKWYSEMDLITDYRRVESQPPQTKEA